MEFNLSIMSENLMVLWLLKNEIIFQLLRFTLIFFDDVNEMNEW